MTAVFLLSLIVFLPAIATLIVALLPGDKPDVIRWFTLAVTAIVMVLTCVLLVPGALQFDTSIATLQNHFNYEWIPSFEIDYFMGLDGISLPLVVLTSFVTLLAMGASWSITKYVKAYCILFLLLETGMLGVFLALDFFLFYVFWEVMLLPMYFLIGVWGGPRKEYAAIKFFLYTLIGSVLMLIAILMLFFNSDLSDPDLADHLIKCQLRTEVEQSALELAIVRAPLRQAVVEGQKELKAAEKSGKGVDAAKEAVKKALAAEAKAVEVGGGPQHTFNIIALQQIGQHTTQLHGFGADPATGKPILFLGHGLQWWAFILLFIGFAIKVPAVPLHTWLPDAHVEAPTPISMILAGVLLKMGGYGIIRICYPICPQGGYDLMWVVCGIGVVSMIYGAFAAMAQTDFKRLVAYSSVSHMGYVVLGLGVWSARSYNGYNADYWEMGINGAMFQMIAHGISSAGMFFLVGVVYDRVHHRNLNEFGGLFGKMPYYTALAIGIFFAGLGLPGLCGFIGEVFVVLSVWKFSYLLAVLSAAVVILTAAYILWAVQRVYLGAEYKGPHEDHLTPSNFRENLIGTVLLAFAILFGIFPYQIPGGPPSVLKYMRATIHQQVADLQAWTRENHPPESPPEKSATATAAASPLPAVSPIALNTPE